MIVNEDNKNTLLRRSISSDLYSPDNREFGNNRYVRRLKSKIASSNSEYNQINMDKLFKEDCLELNVRVNGESDIYLVTLVFSGFLKELKGVLISKNIETDTELNYALILKSLTRAFNKYDIKVHCTCPDFSYRGAYWATKNGVNAGIPENRPSDKTNPNNSKGYCKHINLVLSNTSWIAKSSNVIYNYIKYMKQHNLKLYQKIIYPAIFDKEYDMVQVNQDTINTNKSDKNTINNDSKDNNTSDETLDIVNKWTSTKAEETSDTEVQEKSFTVS